MYFFQGVINTTRSKENYSCQFDWSNIAGTSLFKPVTVSSTLHCRSVRREKETSNKMCHTRENDFLPMHTGI